MANSSLSCGRKGAVIEITCCSESLKTQSPHMVYSADALVCVAVGCVCESNKITPDLYQGRKSYKSAIHDFQ